MDMSDNGYTEQHAQRLNDSFKRWMGRDLIQIEESKSLLQQLLHSNIFILSHGTEPDPVLNFGNQAALNLWEMDRATFVKTPSRLTAEPVRREERSRFIKEVTENGFTENDAVIRVSSTGRRFCIKQVITWNIVDENNHYYGQAATFSDYEYI
ncbi:hypothetical protein JOD18_003082 [Gracilibacillus alcaliphilus]|nr:hypothetical protein [Gracilibacillus alcaliphilus]